MTTYHTLPITARLVHRSEGLVHRYDFLPSGHGEGEANTYAFLRDFLGYSKVEAVAIINLAQASADAKAGKVTR